MCVAMESLRMMKSVTVGAQKTLTCVIREILAVTWTAR